jgi:hypothetical protein
MEEKKTERERDIPAKADAMRQGSQNSSNFDPCHWPKAADRFLGIKRMRITGLDAAGTFVCVSAAHESVGTHCVPKF